MQNNEQIPHIREIKFRGQITDTSEWIYGNYVKARRTSLDGGCKSIIYDESNLPLEVKHETVGQYIGLKDKDGNKIYEGDILFFENVFDSGEYGSPDEDNCTGLVTVKEGHTYFRFPYKNKKGYEDQLLGDYDFDWDSGECVVIGNIYQNPKNLDRTIIEAYQRAGKDHNN